MSRMAARGRALTGSMRRAGAWIERRPWAALAGIFALALTVRAFYNLTVARDYVPHMTRPSTLAWRGTYCAGAAIVRAHRDSRRRIARHSFRSSWRASIWWGVRAV